MTKPLAHIRQNAIAYLALFVALGGTSYAATALPRNSVGTRQIQDGAVTPGKLAGRQIGGTIFAWASVDADGKILAGHGLRFGPARGEDGQYGLILSNQRVSSRCAATASTASVPTAPSVGGSAVANFGRLPPRSPAGVVVITYNAAGQPARMPFVVEVLC
ncbi:MAG: hypothetical protein JOZ07_03030 [Solirubrobacterales bacterium]|nr:hypothetical protein [Solirubrobacterales bacterium]